MTNEKIFAQCCATVRAYAVEVKQDPEQLLQLFTESATKAGCFPAFPVLDALAPVMQAAREGMDKSSTPAAVLSALKRITKAASRDDIKGGWTDKKGRYCVCSGFHAVRLQGASFESIPAALGFEGLEKAMERPASGLYEIELPTVADCKAYRAANKGAPSMQIDKGRRWVKPAFLVDMLQALPGAKAYATDNPLHPIWFETATGDGILLPCRPPKA